MNTGSSTIKANIANEAAKRMLIETARQFAMYQSYIGLIEQGLICRVYIIDVSEIDMHPTTHLINCEQKKIDY